MRQVIPHLLWVGSVMDVADISRVLDSVVQALVDLAANERPAQLTRELIYCRFPLNDGGDNPPMLLRAAVGTVEGLISNEIPTLVYCSAGVSRSIAVVATALAIQRGRCPNEMLADLVHGQPHDVSPLLWSDICKACHR